MVRRECFEAKCTNCHEPQPTKTEFDITEISVPPPDPSWLAIVEQVEKDFYRAFDQSDCGITAKPNLAVPRHDLTGKC